MPRRGEPPELLVIGHIVQDLFPDETWRLGGSASYAALFAKRLGMRTAVLTAMAAELPLGEAFEGVEIARVQSVHSTQFRNVYTAQGRVQDVPQRASPIDAGSLPDQWRDAEIVLLGPVAGEVEAALAECFPKALLGISVQGWLRGIGPDSRVRPVPAEKWEADALLERADMLFVSDEDVPSPGAEAILEEWRRRVNVVVYTRGERGAEVCHEGVWRHIDAFPAKAVDPTGAGDVFATALLVRYRETGEIWEAARFGACAASLIVESEGLAEIPDRAAIDERLEKHPRIVAR